MLISRCHGRTLKNQHTESAEKQVQSKKRQYRIARGESMAKYKHTEAESGQGMFLAVNLKEQLLPGTFEYMLNELVGTKIDTGIFDTNYKNDEKGATAISPRILAKLITYGYLKGVKSSRRLEELCRNNVTAKAL
jgi:hypothetical protein